MLADPATTWQRVAVPGWYGQGERVVEISTNTAVRRHGGMPIAPIRWVLVRDPLRRFDPQASLCTDPARDVARGLRWFAQRRQLEVTSRLGTASPFLPPGDRFAMVRDHLGVETQRQWSDRAIARTTPRLLGLFSPTALLAAQLTPEARQAAATCAWYRKPRPTFSGALAAARREVWRERGFVTFAGTADPRKLPPALRDGITHALCHAAWWPKSRSECVKKLKYKGEVANAVSGEDRRLEQLLHVTLATATRLSRRERAIAVKGSARAACFQP